MTSNKVYEIYTDAAVGDHNVHIKLKTLGANILRVAGSANEAIFFHQYKDDTMGGAPGILLECSDKFIGLVNTLSGIGQIRPSHPMLQTERSPKLQNYFAGKTRLVTLRPPRP
jgi:hypothetical protein